jgi:hypothetical protein
MFASKIMKAPADVSMRARHVGSHERAVRKTNASLSPLGHARLLVGRSDHPLERDADRIANRIVHSPASAVPASHASSHQLGNDPAHQMKERGAEGVLSQAPPLVSEVLRTPGHSLDPATRAFFESRLGHDFSRVRIHADGVAASAAQSVGANAFTLGSHIVFGSGRYAPVSESGQRLLAHELVHVMQQGGDPSHAVLRRDDADPPLKEAKKEDATDAVSDGLKTVATEAGKNDAFKNYGLALAERYALPIWNGMTTGDKAATIGVAAGMYGLGVGSMLSDPAGRAKLSGVNLVAPLALVPYATLTGFSFDLPKSKTDPMALHFSFKGDDLLDLAHRKLPYVPPLTLSFDFTMTVGPDGKVAMPFALANFGVLPGVNVAGGFGVAYDLPSLTSPQSGGPLVPYKSFPQPAHAAPPAGVAAFVTIDLLKAPILPAAVRRALGGDTGEKR